MKPGTFKLFVTPEDTEQIIESLDLLGAADPIGAWFNQEQISDLKRRLEAQLHYRKRTLEHREHQESSQKLVGRDDGREDQSPAEALQPEA